MSIGPSHVVIPLSPRGEAGRMNTAIPVCETILVGGGGSATSPPRSTAAGTVGDAMVIKKRREALDDGTGDDAGSGRLA